MAVFKGKNAQLTGMLLFLPAATYIFLFFVIPTCMLFVYSFWTSSAFVLSPAFELSNYAKVISSESFYVVLFNSMKIGTAVAVLSIALSYPVAAYMVFRARSNTILYVVLASWLTSYLVRIYGWRMILGSNGLINSTLIYLGVIDKPLTEILYNSTAVTIALVHIYVPVTLLILVSALRDVKPEFLEAARDLGASAATTFRRVTVPLLHRGLVSAFMLTFILSAGDFVTPQMLGGRDGATVGLFISTQFRQAGNWPLGAAMAFVSLVMFAAVYIILVAALNLAGLAPFKRSRRGDVT
jgi:spermidine/putrescine transport system permease protein